MSGEIDVNLPEEDEERRRQRKLEEALEVKSLRRIISAYLNYPEAAEEDVQRYERSFRKLPPSHKALLSHYPLKFKKLRRCISMNSYFIFAMLQAFDPPLDMTQDVDMCEEPHVSHTHFDNQLSDERNVCSGHSTSAYGRMCCSQDDRACCNEQRDPVEIAKEMATNEEVETEGVIESKPGSCATDFENKKEADQNCSNHLNGNVKSMVSSPPSDWLDPSIQLNVPLVDVDKVRCIIRNVVRDWAAEGTRERDQCYKPILDELDALFPNRSKESPPACLVPGAGLGRLALEISCLGFISQGNEFSYYMMICSSFILNQTQTAGEWTIYPWIHSNCNSLSDSDQLRPVLIPDIHPARNH